MAAATAVALLPVLIALSEATLLLTHGAVLIGLGPRLSLRYKDLKRRVWYFKWDMASPWALLAVRPARQLPVVAFVMMTYHAALHAAYIIGWDSAHVERVVMMSSDHANERRRYGRWEQAWFVVGTLSDMAVHALVLLALLAPELPPALRLLVA